MDTQLQAVAPRRHLHAVDLMRVLTVALVVGVHTVTHAAVSGAVATGALVIVLHTSREIFFVLTALVLVHSAGRGPVRWPAFWRRRYLCVAIPYVVWSLIYYLADGHALDPIPSTARALTSDLLTGGARYQMYFLLVSMQIYLCFPALRWLLRVTERHHGLLLAGCAAFQLVFAQAVHRGWSPGPVLTAWVHGPGAVLPSYLLYVVAGGVAAWHIDALTAWTLRHRRLVLAGTAASIAASVGLYMAATGAGGESPKLAAGVFQPVVVVESLAIAWAFLIAGLTWVEHGTPGRRHVVAASDASFGVYLAHPLLLQGLIAVTTATGVFAASGRAPLGLVLAILVAVVVPVVYATAAVVTALMRGTPLSLAMTGRRRRRPSPTPAPLAALARVGLTRLSQEVSR